MHKNGAKNADKNAGKITENANKNAHKSRQIGYILLQNVHSVLINDEHRGVHSLWHVEEDVHFKFKSFRMLVNKFCDQGYQQKLAFSSKNANNANTTSKCKKMLKRIQNANKSYLHNLDITSLHHFHRKSRSFLGFRRQIQIRLLPKIEQKHFFIDRKCWECIKIVISKEISSQVY